MVVGDLPTSSAFAHAMLRLGSARTARIASAPQVHARSARRTFFSRSADARGSSRSSSSTSSGDSSNNASIKAMSYFLDAHAACRNKRCRVTAPANGIVSNPESCGEDSFFLTPNLVGVADGVGGWNENGVDPGEISRSLMRNASTIARAPEAAGRITTQELLSRAYVKAVADEKVEAGSTTACIIRLKESASGKPVVEYSNLGDSGFAIVRKGEIVFRSKFQYYGRAPYQLAKIPPRYKVYGAIENQPSDADFSEVEVEEGDIIVLATDGVWDNFSSDLLSAPAFFPPYIAWRRQWQNEIVGLVEVMGEHSPTEAAQHIIKAALRHNLKPDDITVIIAKIVRVAPKL